MLRESILVEEFNDETKEEGEEAEEDAYAGQGGWVEDAWGSYGDLKKKHFVKERKVNVLGMVGSWGLWLPIKMLT